MPVFIRTRQEPRMFVELDFTKELPLKLHDGTIKFDKHDGKGEQVQYGGRTPSEERAHLDKIEKDALREALKKNGLPLNTTDYPRHSSEPETAKLLADIIADDIQLWDPVAEKVNPAVSKGFPGASDIHIASMPGADTRVYNNITFACLEEGISFGIVYEKNWEQLWFYVWKSRQIKAKQDGKHLVVLTKPDGTVGFNQSIEIGWMKSKKMAFSVMRAVSFLRQIRPLVQVCYEGDIEEVRRALAPAVAVEAVQQRNYSGQQLVHRTSTNVSVIPTLRWALESRADPNAQNFVGSTPLKHAAQFGCLAALKVLLDAKADPEIVSKNGQSPLWTAASMGNTECLDLLIQAKADKDKAMNGGATPVFIAAQKNKQDCLDLLLRAKANLDKAKNTGVTPVYMAAENKMADCLMLLLHAKADKDKAMNDGATPLLIAVEKNSKDCLDLLLRAQANVDKAQDDGATPVYIAALTNSADCLKLLLHAKANVNKAKKSSATPVFIAAQNNNADCLKLLLHAKADSMKTRQGQSPLDKAREKGNTACVKLLEDAEAGIGGQKE